MRRLCPHHLMNSSPTIVSLLIIIASLVFIYSLRNVCVSQLLWSHYCWSICMLYSAIMIFVLAREVVSSLMCVTYI